MADKAKLETYLVKLQEGQIDFFDALYYESYKEIYYYILSIIKDKNLAEDLLQDTYMKILNNVKSYKRNTNSFAWMITIARNHTINVYHKRKKEMLMFDEKVVIDEQEPQQPVLDGPLTQMMIETLNQQELEVVNLHLINQMTYKEISKILNRPLGTVIWIYHKAIKKLKEKIGDNNEENRFN